MSSCGPRSSSVAQSSFSIGCVELDAADETPTLKPKLQAVPIMGPLHLRLAGPLLRSDLSKRFEANLFLVVDCRHLFRQEALTGRGVGSNELDIFMGIWQYGYMARVKTTLSIDEELMRHVRVRAARTGRTQSDVLDEALREGLGVVQRIRAKSEADENEALALASKAVHEVRAESSR